LAGDTARQATSPEVKKLRSESAVLKEVVAELRRKNRMLREEREVLKKGPPISRQAIATQSV